MTLISTIHNYNTITITLVYSVSVAKLLLYFSESTLKMINFDIFAIAVSHQAFEIFAK